MLVDLPLEQLRTYRPDIREPADFDAFWQRSLAETRQHRLAANFVQLDDPLYRLVDVFDASFAGWGGETVKAWLITPAKTTQRLPCIVQYLGYGGGRSLPIDHVATAAAGVAIFVMDTRGQGSGWSPGETPDVHGGGPQHPGFMTRGVLSPDEYYYRRVFVDAVRALEAAATHPAVDPQRIAVSGGSQGGGIAIAAAALATQHVKLLAADVPFLCHFRRATQITDKLPYGEIAAYLKCHRDRVEQVFATLAYFDGANMALRVRAPALFSVGLMDLVCPPSTIFAAYNRLSGEKEMRVYEYNEHEGGGVFQAVDRLRWLVQRL